MSSENMLILTLYCIII